jgi:hypothetical protein
MFVRGAVSEREGLVPVLTRFCISGGRIQGSNGRVAIDAACEELAGIEALVPADRFIAAANACAMEPSIKTTAKGQLRMTRGAFSAQLPTQPVTDFPRMAPSTGRATKAPAVMDAFARLREFIGEDHVRQWSLTVAGDGERLYATNNNSITSVPSPIKMQLPSFLLDEVLRIGQPERMACDDSSVTFFYGDDWLRSQLILDKWPLETAQKHIGWTKKTPPIPDDLVQTIETLVPLCPNPKLPIVCFTENGVATEPGESQAEVKGDKWPSVSFDARNLLPLLRAATHFTIDEATGLGRVEGEDGFRGIIAGRKYAS